MLKDEEDCSYIGEGDARPLKHGQNFHLHITKSMTFCVMRFFMEFSKLAEGGRGELCVKILYSKNNALCVTFFIIKKQTLCITF